MVYLNLYLCLSQIILFINDILKWNRNDSNRVFDILDIINGNVVVCKYNKQLV